MDNQLAFSVTDFALTLYFMEKMALEKLQALMNTGVFINYTAAGLGQQFLCPLNFGCKLSEKIILTKKKK